MKGRAFAGGDQFGGGKAPFTSYAANITQDKATGIGAWTDDQIMRAIREGKRPDGSSIGAPMAIELYRNISDADAKAIVAYLRTVKPAKNTVPKSLYRRGPPKSYGPKLGNWTDAEIKRAITKGISRDGTKLQPPMAYGMYNTMSDGDLNGLVAYLRSLKALANN